MKWRSILGAIWRNLPNEERSALGSNSGVYIELVVKDTPAFRNDVLAGGYNYEDRRSSRSW